MKPVRPSRWPREAARRPEKRATVRMATGEQGVLNGQAVVCFAEHHAVVPVRDRSVWVAGGPDGGSVRGLGGVQRDVEADQALECLAIGVEDTPLVGELEALCERRHGNGQRTQRRDSTHETPKMDHSTQSRQRNRDWNATGALSRVGCSPAADVPRVRLRSWSEPTSVPPEAAARPGSRGASATARA